MHVSEMVSFSMEDPARLGPLVRLRTGSSSASHSPEVGAASILPDTENLEESMADVLVDAMLCEQDGQQQQQQQGNSKKVLKNLVNRSEQLSASVEQNAGSSSIDASQIDNEDDQANMIGFNDQDVIDEDQLRRILTCKRLSEGCNRLNSSFIRKNSLHMVEELPPLTEGEAMKHMSYHMSQSTIEHSAASSGSSGSLRQGARQIGSLSMKRGSQDENTTSCSSSTSLERSPTRRRSSTVSQCSSVLSEATRNQLNFDLSPDLAPDSSLLEANCISPIDYQDERPASPEPSSYTGDSFDFRPTSRVSGCIPEDELLEFSQSPDSPQIDSTDNIVLQNCAQFEQNNKQPAKATTCWTKTTSENNEDQDDEQANFDTHNTINGVDPLEKLIRNVRTVAVNDSSEYSINLQQKITAETSADRCNFNKHQQALLRLKRQTSANNTTESEPMLAQSISDTMAPWPLQATNSANVHVQSISRASGISNSPSPVPVVKGEMQDSFNRQNCSLANTNCSLWSSSQTGEPDLIGQHNYAGEDANKTASNDDIITSQAHRLLSNLK